MTGKYEGTLTVNEFPALRSGDKVLRAAFYVMVDGHSISEAAELVGITPQAVSMRCKRIAKSSYRRRKLFQSDALYDLVRRKLARDDSKDWDLAAIEIINFVEDV